MSNRWSRISWLSNPASESDRISTGNNNDADSVSNRSPEVDSNLLRTLTEAIHDAVQHAIEPLREEIAALRALVLTVKPERKVDDEPADAQNLPRVKVKQKKLESAIVEKMDNIAHRAIIFYIGIKGLSPKEIQENMVATLKKDAPSYNMVKKEGS